MDNAKRKTKDEDAGRFFYFLDNIAHRAAIWNNVFGCYCATTMSLIILINFGALIPRDNARAFDPSFIKRFFVICGRRGGIKLPHARMYTLPGILTPSAMRHLYSPTGRVVSCQTFIDLTYGWNLLISTI